MSSEYESTPFYEMGNTFSVIRTKIGIVIILLQKNKYMLKWSEHFNR